MAKRKITVTVDEGLVEAVQALGSEPLSSVVNQALEAEVDRLARAEALGRMLAQWDEELGPVSAEAAAAAVAAFDAADAVGTQTEVDPSTDRQRRGAA